MPQKDVEEIVKNLRVVRDFGEFPKGKNYLYSRYKSAGLVKMSNFKKVDSFGYKIKGQGDFTTKTKVRPTKKGYAFLRATKNWNI